MAFQNNIIDPNYGSESFSDITSKWLTTNRWLAWDSVVCKLGILLRFFPTPIAYVEFNLLFLWEMRWCDLVYAFREFAFGFFFSFCHTLIRMWRLTLFLFVLFSRMQITNAHICQATCFINIVRRCFIRFKFVFVWPWVENWLNKFIYSLIELSNLLIKSLESVQ